MESPRSRMRGRRKRGNWARGGPEGGFVTLRKGDAEVTDVTWERLRLFSAYPPTPMKNSTYITVVLAMAVALFASPPLAAETNKAKHKELIDFTFQDAERAGIEVRPIKKYSWSSGDWQDKIRYLPKQGLLVPYLGSKGNFGGDKSAKLSEYGFFEVVLTIGNRNKAQSIKIVLIDGDETEAVWMLPLAGKPVGKSLVFRLPLDKPDEEQKPGKTPGFDKAKLRKWQVSGNWQAAEAEVLIERFLAGQ